ncbi:hypothetical protein ACFSM5_17460 [Lacibacterium aquatile]|uniref:DUF2786 domain-containing protein n=1 Tax=Lacibacterium aquatile TaxID=1168082 RepID=A0ABW5DUV7_9PROT
MESQFDRDRLVKLLARLDSDSDAEVLAAAKLAVRHLRENEIGWDEAVSTHARGGLKSWFDGWAGFIAETRRRISAERAAEQWQSIARRFEEELAAQKAQPVQATATAKATTRKAAANDAAAPSVERTGNELIDRLLASPRLDAISRARVEAIASWFRRTHELTGAEIADLEQFSRSVAA